MVEKQQKRHEIQVNQKALEYHMSILGAKVKVTFSSFVFYIFFYLYKETQETQETVDMPLQVYFS